MKVLLLTATVACLFTGGLAARILADSSGAVLALFLTTAAVTFIILDRLIAVPSARSSGAPA